LAVSMNSLKYLITMVSNTPVKMELAPERPLPRPFTILNLCDAVLDHTSPWQKFELE